MVKTLDFLSKKDINCKTRLPARYGYPAASNGRAPVQYSINNGPYQPDSTFSNPPLEIMWSGSRMPAVCIDSLLISLVQAYPDLTHHRYCHGKPVTCTGGGADGGWLQAPVAVKRPTRIRSTG